MISLNFPEQGVATDRVSKRLWGLLDIMEAFQPQKLLEISRDLLNQMGLFLDDKAQIPAGWRERVIENLEGLRDECDSLVLTVAAQQTRDLLELLSLGSYQSEVGTVSRGINMVCSTISTEMNLRTFFALSPENKRFYEPSNPLLGKEFEDKFPSAIFDTDEAGKCLALGRPTAAVFHSMRVLEIGVRSVARCLNIDDPLKPADRNWGFVLREIKKGIDATWPTQADRHGGDGALFEALYVSLDAVRNPWRNATMHVENKYTPEEAEHILMAVRGFTMKIAARMDENGQPLA